MRGFVSGSSRTRRRAGCLARRSAGAIFTLLTGAALSRGARPGRRGSSRPGSAFVRRVRAARLDQAPASATRDPRGLEAASRWLGVRAELDREPGIRDPLAAAGRALGPTPGVRRGARGRVGCEPPAADGRRVGHAKRGRRTAVAGAVSGSRIRATGRPAGARIRSSALLVGLAARRRPRRSSCTRPGLVPRCRCVAGRPVRRCLHRRGSRRRARRDGGFGLADSRRGHRPDPASA